VAFDRRGFRLGYGGGFYDRYIAGLPRDTDVWLVGLAYGFQIVEQLPAQDWDKPVHGVCGEEALLWF